MQLVRPYPPEALVQLGTRFEPAPNLERWMREAFIEEHAERLNPDHKHLRQAKLGVLWTNALNVRGGQNVVGTAEIPRFQGNPWQKARQEAQVKGWFGEIPDFLITLSSWYAREAGAASFCATVEHELYHCGQARDEYGDLKFRRKDWSPVFFLRPHDTEEFVGVVRRWGPGAAAGGVKELVDAANNPPEIEAAQIVGLCGTCQRFLKGRPSDEAIDSLSDPFSSE